MILADFKPQESSQVDTAFGVLGTAARSQVRPATLGSHGIQFPFISGISEAFLSSLNSSSSNQSIRRRHCVHNKCFARRYEKKSELPPSPGTERLER